MYVWLVDGLGGTYAQVGVASLILTLSEVVILQNARDALARLGVVGTLFLCCAAYGVRLGIYLAMTRTTTWLIYLSEPFHALTFSIVNVALGTHLRQVVVQEELSARFGAAAQATLFSCASLGRAAGFLIGGEVYSRWCARALWVASIQYAVPLMVVLVAAFSGLERARNQREMQSLA